MNWEAFAALGAAVIAFLGTLGAVAKKWRKAAKKMVLVSEALDEVQDVFEVFYDEEGNPKDLSKFKKADLINLAEQLREAITAVQKVVEDP